MKLSDRVLEGIADMVVGDHKCFPYRSSSRITKFFNRCGFPFVHNGITRRFWAKDRLAELNLGPSSNSDLPPDDILRVLEELFEPEDFEGQEGITIETALEALNTLLKRSGLVAYIDASAHCHVRNAGSGSMSQTMRQQPRPLSPEEITQRLKLEAFLDTASEDELTQEMLVPFFRRLGLGKFGCSNTFVISPVHRRWRVDCHLICGVRHGTARC